MNAPKITVFMLVTNRDALIADYAVKSYNKVHDEFKDELPEAARVASPSPK